MPEFILHITTRRAWAEAQQRGGYRTESLAREGFIHLSRPAQVVAVADFLYRGRFDLVLLCVLPEKLTAVVKVMDFPSCADSSFQLPTDISSSVTP